MLVTKDSIISDVLTEKPEAVEILMEYWLWCVWCWVADFESIWDWARAHWMTEIDIDNIINDLNEIN